MRRAARAVLAIAMVAGCKRSSAPAAVVDAAAGAIAAEIPDAAGGPRCTLLDGGARLGEGRVEIGEAVPTGDGVAIGLVRAAPGGAQAIVATVRLDAGRPVVAASLPALAAPVSPDWTPPLPVASSGAVTAVVVAPTAARADAGGATRPTPIAWVPLAEPAAKPLATIAAHGDDSIEVDAVAAAPGPGVLVAWEEDLPDRGAIAVALAASGDAKGRVVSPTTSEAESPRVARRAGGYWVAWIARRNEAPADGGEPERAEVPAERRAYQWIELVALDDHAAPSGPVRRLTSATGRVGDFDLATRPTGELDVLARDDEQPSEGAGGRILRVTVRGDAIDPPAVVVGDGVGRGAIDLVTTPRGDAWLAFADVADRTRLVPLSESRAPVGAPTSEPALEDARVLLVASSAPSAPSTSEAAGAPGGRATMLVAFPEDPTQLRVAECRR